MFIKQPRLIFSLMALAVLSCTAQAQVGSLRGTVGLKQADGKEVPVPNAEVDTFRVDLPGAYRVKTNARGEFVYAGLPYDGTYVIAVSAPEAKPALLPNIKVGRDQEFHLSMEPGDGRRFTSDDARAAAANAPNISAIGSVETLNELKNRTFRDGNEALRRKNYDDAIKLFEEGLAVFPEEAAFLANLSVALRFRGIEQYNSVLNARNENARAQLIAAAKNDFHKAVETANSAADAVKLQPAPEKEADQNLLQNLRINTLAGRLEAMRMLVLFVDPSQATNALAALYDYLETENDPARKIKAENDMGLMLLQSKNISLATEHFRRTLVGDPDNLDAIAGFGLALFEADNRGTTSEAGAYLQRFVDEAPPDHPMKARVIAALKTLQSRQ